MQMGRYMTAYKASFLWPSREFLMIAARDRSSLPLGFEGPAKDFSLRKKGSFLRRCKSTLRDSCAPACGRLWHSRDPQPRHPEGIFIALQGEGVHCPTQARGLLTLKIRPGLPSAITTAWCASVRGRGAPILADPDCHRGPAVRRCGWKYLRFWLLRRIDWIPNRAH